MLLLVLQLMASQALTGLWLSSGCELRSTSCPAACPSSGQCTNIAHSICYVHYAILYISGRREVCKVQGVRWWCASRHRCCWPGWPHLVAANQELQILSLRGAGCVHGLCAAARDVPVVLYIDALLRMWLVHLGLVYIAPCLLKCVALARAMPRSTAARPAAAAAGAMAECVCWWLPLCVESSEEARDVDSSSRSWSAGEGLSPVGGNEKPWNVAHWPSPRCMVYRRL